MAASIVLSKCSKHNKTFGIRVEKQGNDWVRTWAFPIDESKAKREGFDKTKITGSLNFVEGFPGCPYCGSYGVFICECGKISCIEDKAKSIRCYWCNTSCDDLGYVDVIDVKSGGF